MKQINASDNLKENCLNPFYVEYLDSYVKTTIEKNTKLIKQSNGQITDYRAVFDKIADLPKISPIYKDLLLSKYLLLIGNSFSKGDFEKYLKKCRSIVDNKEIIGVYNSKYIDLYSNSKNIKKSLTLNNYREKPFELIDLISNNQDKIIYVDFWASWCAPCRAVMNSSSQLKEKYKNQKILFVYISIDKDTLAWEKANKAEKLNNYRDSYIAVNQETSDFLKTMNLTTIPRYVLYKKKGVLVNSNAPNPGSSELTKLLDKLLQIK